jgi:hypothetical protein
VLLAVAGVHGLAEPAVLRLEHSHLPQQLRNLALKAGHLAFELLAGLLVELGLLLGAGLHQ